LQKISRELLEKSKKILFVKHLAIGDFSYLHNCFHVFKKEYPHLQVDLWIDELRRTRFFGDWKHLRSYGLIDWVAQTQLFDKIYSETYSWGRAKKQIKNARKEDYPLVISLSDFRLRWSAKLARKLSPQGFVAGFGASCKLNVSLDPRGEYYHQSAHQAYIYQSWFTQFFGLSFTPENAPPSIAIPKEWISYAKLCFIKWGIDSKEKRFDKVIFINAFAKGADRCWPIDRVITLIHELRQKERFSTVFFIVNIDRSYYDAVKALFSNFCLFRVFLFTADENFFQLPAIISLCDLVVSVETSTIHLAQALKIPVIALMRKKNYKWVPFYKDLSKVIFTASHKEWVEDITCTQLVSEIEEFGRPLT
jgi:heptosyltransferase III